MKNTQTHLFYFKLERNFNLFRHSLFFLTLSSLKVGFSTGKKKEYIISEKYCNNWSAKFQNHKLRASWTSAKHIRKWNIRELEGFTPKVFWCYLVFYAVFLTITFRLLRRNLSETLFSPLANRKTSLENETIPGCSFRWYLAHFFYFVSFIILFSCTTSQNTQLCYVCARCDSFTEILQQDP